MTNKNPSQDLRNDVKKSVRRSALFYALTKKVDIFLSTMEHIGPRTYRIAPDSLIALRQSLFECRNSFYEPSPRSVKEHVSPVSEGSPAGVFLKGNEK